MISIIGGGPIGNYAAYLLAKKGHEVEVYEEHRKIGRPIQCTGIITSQLDRIIKPRKEFMVNKVNRIRIISPSNDYLDVKFHKANYVVDRTSFDAYFGDLAKDEGVKFNLGKKFEDAKKGGKIKFKVGNKIKETDYLIGADGPRSKVAKSFNLYNNRKFIYGIQAVMDIKVDPDLVIVYLGFGGFGWIVPENESRARVGITAYKNAQSEFDRLIKRIGKGKIIGWQSGMIPLYDRKVKTQKDNVFLIGDAATQVKALTHGGLVMGFLAGKALANSLEDYEKNWRKSIGRDLWLNLVLREALDKFSNKNFDDLVDFFKQEKLKEIISNYDRDFPSQFLLKIIAREPRLLKFLPKAF